MPSHLLKLLEKAKNWKGNVLKISGWVTNVHAATGLVFAAKVTQRKRSFQGDAQTFSLISCDHKYLV